GLGRRDQSGRITLRRTSHSARKTLSARQDLPERIKGKPLLATPARRVRASRGRHGTREADHREHRTDEHLRHHHPQERMTPHRFQISALELSSLFRISSFGFRIFRAILVRYYSS